MNKTALITGSSRGIGKAIALSLAKVGYQIVVNYANNEQAAGEVVRQIMDSGSQAIAVQADVSKAEHRTRLLQEAKNKFGSINVLVNNAGITRDNLLIRMTEQQWSQVIQTNLLSVIELTELVIPEMPAGSHIVNISSVVGVHGNAGQSNYSTAKAALLSYSKIKARELMPKIKVNCIAPGLVATDMTARFDTSQLSNTKLQRPAQPEDIASAVRFLAEDGSYVTGQILEIDNGLSLWSDIYALAN